MNYSILGFTLGSPILENYQDDHLCRWCTFIQKLSGIFHGIPKSARCLRAIGV